MKFTPRNKFNPAFNYASFADMALQWLIFFLLSWSFVVTPGIKVQLPKMQTGEVQSDRQSVFLTGTGRIFWATKRLPRRLSHRSSSPSSTATAIMSSWFVRINRYHYRAPSI